MAGASKDPGGKGGRDAGRTGGKVTRDGTLAAAGRDDLVEPDDGRTLTAAGRDELGGMAPADGIPPTGASGTIRTTGGPTGGAAGGMAGGPAAGAAADTPAGSVPAASSPGSIADRTVSDRTVPDLHDDPIDGPGGPGGREPPGPHGGGPHDDDDHAARGGFAAAALKVLVLALVIFVGALWLVPNVAPHLPAGISRHLMPGQAELDARLAAMDERIAAGTGGVSGEVAALSEQVAALAGRVEAAERAATLAEESASVSAASAERNAVAGDAVARAEAAAAEAARLADTATTAATEAGKVAAAATRDTGSLARRMAGFESRVAELADRVQAVSDGLAENVTEGQASAPELGAAFAELRAEVETFRQRLAEQPEFLTADDADRFATQDDLRSARLALGAEIQQAIAALPAADALVVREELEALRQEAEQAVAELDRRLGEVESTATAAAETASAAEAAAGQAVERVGGEIRQAALGAAAASLTSRLVNGVPFADALDEAASLMETPPPEELTAVAGEGVATTEELLRRFNRPARDALEADIEARSGGGILGRASARVQGVIAGRPAGEQEGETVDAMLSRVEARLGDGDAAAALAEAEALPEASRDALGDWLAALRARVAAVEAAESWLTPSASGTQG